MSFKGDRFINFFSNLILTLLCRDGLIKMKVVYEQNNALGDPLTIEGQLTENCQKMEKLQAQLKKFEGYLMECNGSTERSPSSLRKANNSSVSEDSLSRSASESSVGQKEELSSPSLNKSELNNHEDEKEKSAESENNYEKLNPVASNGLVVFNQFYFEANYFILFCLVYILQACGGSR